MGLLLAVEETGEVVSVPWSLKYFLIRSGAVQNCHSRLSCATPLINTMQCGRSKGTWNPGRESTLGVINFYILFTWDLILEEKHIASIQMCGYAM